MSIDTNTNKRLIALREALNFKNPRQFALAVGVDPSYIWNIENNKKNVGLELLRKIKKLRPDINEEWITSGKGEMLSIDINSSPDPLSVRYMTVYARVSAGLSIQAWNEKSGKYKLAISGHPKLDKIKEKLWGFEVDGDSMKDRFRHGDIVASTYINLPEQKPRDLDIVATFFNSDPETSKATIKLFQWDNKSKETFILKSINPYFPDSHHTFEDIRKMFRVHCVALSFVDYRNEK